VPEIEEAITELESKGVSLKGRGMYVTRPDLDIKAAVFKPETVHGMPLEVVEFGYMEPLAVACLDWVRDMPWMQPPVKPTAPILAGKFDHLNLFQNDLEVSSKFFSDILGIKFIGPIERTEAKIRIAFSDAGINIIQPTGEDSLGISEYLKKHGEGTGCLGFKVPDIESAISVFESKGVRLISRGLYGENPDSDIKSAIFDPDTAYGLMLELVEYHDTTPVALANLNWVNKLPWMD
jgi:catechol 2,3-dioxygenase-like lactoylglutathione lyase family enzyme